VGILENQFRTLPLEVIAGEDRLETTVKQHMTRFKMNYAEVCLVTSPQILKQNSAHVESAGSDLSKAKFT